MKLIKCFPHQGKLIQAPFVFPDVRFFFEICGYAAGKTASLVYLVLMVVEYLQGSTDAEGNRPKVVVAGITLTFLQKTFSGRLLNILDNSNTKYDFNKKDNIISVCGVDIYLIPIKDEGEIFGYDVYCAIVDELDELPTAQSMGVVKALNDRVRQSIEGKRPTFLAFATTAQGLKGTYQTIQEFLEKKISFLLIRGSTKDNTSLEKSYVEAMYKVYDKKQTACYLEGQFINVDSGMVFPQYDRQRNFLPDTDDLWTLIPAGENVFIAQDFNQGSGFNKALAIWVYKGVMFIVKEYSFPDWTKAPKVFRYDFPKQNIWWIPDMTYKDNFSMAGRALRAYGIKLVLKKSNPLVSDRNVVINAAFGNRVLVVCSNCTDCDKAISIYQYDKNTGKPAKGKTEKAPDHFGDCLGYAVYHIVGNIKEFKQLFDVTIGRFSRLRDSSDAVVVDGVVARTLKSMKIEGMEDEEDE